MLTFVANQHSFSITLIFVVNVIALNLLTVEPSIRQYQAESHSSRSKLVILRDKITMVVWLQPANKPPRGGATSNEPIGDLSKETATYDGVYRLLT